MKAKINPRADKVLWQNIHENMAKAMELLPYDEWPVDRCFISMVDAAYDTIMDSIEAAKKALKVN